MTHTIGVGAAANPFADIEQAATITAEGHQWAKSDDELKQRTIEWFLHRWDKFTGSEIPNLMKSGRGKAGAWGQTAKNVILLKRAYATMSDEGRRMQAEIEMAKDFRQTQWGNTYEPEARALYAKLTGYEVREVGFMVNPAMAYNGGSFDGEVIGVNMGGKMAADYADGNVLGIIEIKCPYDPIKHDANYCLKVDGLTQSHEYYGQIQNNINVAGVDWCDFISYDPRRASDDLKIAIIRVMRDQIYINGMVDRLQKAKRILDGITDGRSIDNMCLEVEQYDECIEVGDAALPE